MTKKIGILNICCGYCRNGSVIGSFENPNIKDCRHFSFFVSTYKNNKCCFPVCGKKDVAVVNATCKECCKNIYVLNDHPLDETYFSDVKCIWCVKY